MRTDRRPVLMADPPLFWFTLALLAVGLLMVFSATVALETHRGLYLRQAFSALVALAAMYAAARVPTRIYEAFAPVLYGLSLLLLAATLVVGQVGLGAQRWLGAGPLRFQPSEVAKITTVLLLARYLADRTRDVTRVRTLAAVTLMAGIPALLVLKEPDLGTSLSFPALTAAMLFWAGLPPAYFLFLALPLLGMFFAYSLAWGLFLGACLLAVLYATRPRASLAAAVVVLYLAVAVVGPRAWNHLEDYQKERVVNFVNPGHDPSGTGWQLLQSKIAIGSGGVLGRGFLRGTQKRLAFLPMQHTDFIYSVVGEELGFWGCTGVLLLYSVWLLRGLKIATRSRNRFAGLMCVGVVGALSYHVLINVWMTLGLAPVTGLPLPLLSYGGSSLVITLFEVGLLLGAAAREREF
ncbi:MAG TPA: rod shape-determining protein RodA [Candidatus Saccharimonadales bacterium]|nr:rod shape-determining protein RodA [Candidatus Saccharimonadales bacterium]